MSLLFRKVAALAAAFTLLMSLFLVIQGFADPPEALAGCVPDDGCQSWYSIRVGCCCPHGPVSCGNGLLTWRRWCWHVGVDCDIDWYLETNPIQTCTGSYCCCI